MSLIRAFVLPHPPLAVPEVGKGNERGIKKTLDNYEKVAKEIANLKPDTIILSSPHAPSYRDYFHVTDASSLKGDLSMFGAPQVKIEVPCDRGFLKALTHKAKASSFPAGQEGYKGNELDHGSMVPLYFIMSAYDDFSLVRISPSGLSLEDHYKLGEMVRDIAEESDERIVFVASGDLSHKLTYEGPYGFHEAGPNFDRKVTDILKNRDLRGLLSMDPTLVHDAAQCGLSSLVVMAGALGGESASSELLSYEGPFGVGYAVARYTPEPREAEGAVKKKDHNEDKDPYVTHARNTLKRYFGKNVTAPPAYEESPDPLKAQKSGVFVTLRNKGELRGCIGTIEPTTETIGEEISRNAIAAATQDPRFKSVDKEELRDLDISVDVLGDAEPVESFDALDPYIYGVIVESGPRKGVLLPNLEGIETADHQLSIALRKANIDPNESYTIKRFKVHRHTG